MLSNVALLSANGLLWVEFIQSKYVVTMTYARFGGVEIV